MKWVKPVITLILAGVMLYFFWPLVREIHKAWDLFLHAHWAWLPVVIVVQVVSYLALSWLNLLCLHPFPGRRPGLWAMAGVLSSVAFIEVAVPSAGGSGFALRARLLGKYGYSVESSSFTFLLESIFLVISMGTVGLFGIVYLLKTGDLSKTQSGQMAGIVGIIGLLTWYFWHLMTNPTKSRRLVNWGVRTWNRLFGRWKRLASDSAEARLDKFQEGLGQLREMSMWPFFVAAYGRTILDVVSLGLCFELFGYEISIGTLLTGYALIMLTSATAALPGGQVTAELAVPTIFGRLGAPADAALTAGLTYRLIAFWIMRLIGFVAWQVMDSRTEAAPPPAVTEEEP